MPTTNSNKAIEAQLAAQRPKISKAEALRRRQASLRRLKITDVVSVLILTVVLIGIQSGFGEAANPENNSEVLFNAFLAFCAAVTLQLAFMIGMAFMRYGSDRRVSEDKEDRILKGVRFTYFVPLIALAVLVPSIASGIFVDDEMNTIGVIGTFIFAMFICVLLAPLVAAFVIAPLMLIFNGVVALIRRDKSNMHLGVIGLLIAGLTLFIALGSAAVTPSAPYPVGSVQAAFAILGIPGNYVIENETFLWIVRGIVVFYVAIFVYIRSGARRDRQVVEEKAAKQ